MPPAKKRNPAKGTWTTHYLVQRPGQVEFDTVDLYFDVAGSGRPSQITIKALKGLTGSEIKRLPWSKWIRNADVARRYGWEDADLVEWADADTVDVTYGGSIEAPQSPERGSHPGRRGHPHDHYVQVAADYEALLKTGSRSPTQDIATARNYSRDTVAGWIRVCRDRDLLPPARKGKAG